MQIKIDKSQIQKIALAYMIVWAISPPLAYGTLYRVVFIFCFLVWDFCAINRKGKSFFAKQFFLFIFLAIIVLISYFADGPDGITYNLQFILFFLFLPVFYYYYYSKEDTTWILSFTMILVIVWNITTILGYSQIHNISRLLAKDFEGAEYYSSRGIGGYGYVYFLVFIIPVVETMLIRGYKKFQRSFVILSIATLILSATVIIKAGYTIALILMIYSIVGVLVLRKAKNPILFSLISVPLLVIVLLNMENILTFAMKYARGTMYQAKINDMLLTLTDSETTGTVAARAERYIRSVRLFLESPVWGQLSRADVGKHSAILDKFAQFGIVIGSWALSYFTKAQRCIYKMHIDEGMAFSMIVTSVAFFLMNNVAVAQGAGLFVFYIAAANKLYYAQFK